MNRIISNFKFQISIFILSISWCQDCTAGDCLEGYGNYIYEDGSKYMGMFMESKKSGEGIFIYPDGSQYTGYFEDDKMHGIGTFTF